MLEPLTPRQGAQDYLDGRTDLTQSSKENHKYRLRRFVEWCEENEIENLNDVTGRTLHRFKVWRAEDVNNVTLKNQLGTIRVFLRFCEKMDAVQKDLSEKLELPELGIDEDVDDTTITSEEADAILSYLNRYEYASSDTLSSPFYGIQECVQARCMPSVLRTSTRMKDTSKQYTVRIREHL